MLLLLLNYVVLRALWKIDVHLINTLKSLYYFFLFFIYSTNLEMHHLNTCTYITILRCVTYCRSIVDNNKLCLVDKDTW